MADQDKQTDTQRRISDDQRYRYIGFEVYPGKPKDLFKSEAEKEQLVDAVVKRRTRGDILRDQCTLLSERVSNKERLVLAVASVVVLISLFLPWYSIYNERVIESAATTAPATRPAEETAPLTDTLAAAATGADTGADTAAMEPSAPVRREEVISSVQTRARVERDYETLSGLGSLLAIGSVGGALFSSGPALMLTAVVMLLFTLLSIALPIYMLVTLFKSKKLDDQYALTLKRQLRLNWLPVILFVVALILSFMGADYGSGVAGTFTSIGESYGPGVFLGSLTYGILVALGAFIVMAAKGIEI